MEGLLSKLLIRRAFLWLSISIIVISVVSLIACYFWHWKAILPLVFLAGTEILQLCQNFSGGDSSSNTSTISLNSAVYAVLGTCVGILVYVFFLTKYDSMHDLMVSVLQFGCGLVAQFVMFREVAACQRQAAATDRLGLVPAAISSSWGRRRGAAGGSVREGDCEDEAREEEVSLWRDVWTLVKRRAAEGLQRSVWVALRMGLVLTLLWALLKVVVLCADVFCDEATHPFATDDNLLLQLAASLSLADIWLSIAALCLLCLVCYNAIADGFDVLMSYPMNMHKASLQLVGSAGKARGQVQAQTQTQPIHASSADGSIYTDSVTVEDYCSSASMVVGVLASRMPFGTEDIQRLWADLQRARALGVSKFAAHQYSCHTVHSGRQLASEIVSFSHKVMLKCLRESLALHRSGDIASVANAGGFSWLDPFASAHMGAAASSSSVYLCHLLSHQQQGMFSLLQYASLEDSVRVFSAETRVAQLKRSAFFANPQVFLHFILNMITRINMFTLHMDVLMQYCDSSNYATYCCRPAAGSSSKPAVAVRDNNNIQTDGDDILLRKGAPRGAPQSAGLAEAQPTAAAPVTKETEAQDASPTDARAQAIEELCRAMYAQNARLYPMEFESAMGPTNPLVYAGRRFAWSVLTAAEKCTLRALLSNKLSKSIPAIGAFDFSSTLVVNSSNKQSAVDSRSEAATRASVGSKAAAGGLSSADRSQSTSARIGSGFNNSNERTNKQLLFSRALSVPATALHQSKNVLFSHASSAFATSPKYLQMVMDSLTIVTQVFMHSNDDESNVGLLEGFLPLALKSLIALSLSCNRYLAIYCDNYHQVGSNSGQMKIKLLRSVALQYLPELDGLLLAVEDSMRTIMGKYRDVLFKGMGQSVRGGRDSTVTNADVFNEITHSTSVYRDNFSLAEWKFLCEVMTKAQ